MSSTNSFPPEYLDLIKAVARLETKIDMMLDQHAAHDTEMKSIRSRVESLERTRAHSKGAMTVLSAIGGIIGAVVTMLIKNFLTPNP